MSLKIVEPMFANDHDHSEFRAALADRFRKIPPEHYLGVLEQCEELIEISIAESGMRIREAQKASPLHREIRKNRIRSERAGKIGLAHATR